MRKKLVAEAKAFDRIVTSRSKKRISYDLRKKKVNKVFYNNPWRYHDTRKIAFLDKINFVKKNIKKKDEILDVGCGGGSLSLELARNGNKVTGIDISKKSLKTAKNNCNEGLLSRQRENVKFYNKSYDEFSKLKKKFDVIVFFKTLHHLQNTKKVIDITCSLLKKEGKIIIVEPLRDDISKTNIAFAFLARTLATTWEDKKKKLKKNLNLKSEFYKLFKEYTYTSSDKGYDQSHFDNSISSSSDVLKYVKKKFIVDKLLFKDVFKDKLIGGLRGKERENELNFISKFDDFLIKENIVNGYTIMLVGRKNK